jgi:hypothetical protein
MPKLDKRKIMDTVVELNPDLSYLRDHKFYFMGPLGKYFGSVYSIPFDMILICYDDDEVKAIGSLAHELDHADYAMKVGALRSLYDNLVGKKPIKEHAATARKLRTLQKLGETSARAREIYNIILRNAERLKSSKNPLKKRAYNLYYSGLEFEPFPEDQTF